MKKPNTNIQFTKALLNAAAELGLSMRKEDHGGKPWFEVRRHCATLELTNTRSVAEEAYAKAGPGAEFCLLNQSTGYKQIVARKSHS